MHDNSNAWGSKFSTLGVIELFREYNTEYKTKGLAIYPWQFCHLRPTIVSAEE